MTSRRSALLGSAVLLMLFPSASVFAADPIPYKSAASPVESGWYVNGSLEAGGNIFLQRPPSGYGKTATTPFWLTPLTTDSRAKFEEYGRVPAGPFLSEIDFQAGSRDGRYVVDFWATDIALNNQSYYLGLTEAGRHYFSVGWDQVPHTLSTSAKSIFGGVGSTNLTVDDATQAYLQARLATGGTTTQTQTMRNEIDAYINNTAPMSNIALKTLREKFFTAYRGTPSDAWDFNVAYSNEHRTGTRPLGIGWGFGSSANPRPSTGAIEVPQPLDDRTQNLDASGEYVGTTPWGTRWNTALKYSGSFFDNDNKSMDVENPFCITCSPAGFNVSGGAPPPTNYAPGMFRYGLYPNNTAHGVTLNSGVELPFLKSRYVSTTQYTMYRQNDPFIDTATNGITVGLGANQLRPYPAASLNGELNAFLSNNVLTSHLSDSVTNTLRVRYYDVKDRTPVLTFANYVYADGGVASTLPLTRNSTTHNKLSISDDVKWRATKKLTVGAGYFFERLTPEHSEIDHLTENGGKVFVDHKAWTWLNSRTSFLYSQRRYDNYHDTGNVQTRPVRIFFVANRDRHKLEHHVDIAAFRNVTVTPHGGLRWDDYPDGVPNLLGKTEDHSWNIGSDLSIRATPDLRFTFSYNYEEHKLHMAVCCGASSGAPSFAVPGPNTWTSDITQRYNTFIAAADWKAIPNKLDFKVEYLLVLANEATLTTPCTAGIDSCTGRITAAGITNAQFPDEKNRFQRFNVIGRYFVDPEVVRRMGWNGEVVAKLRYTWERNRNTNWATDTFTPYSPSEVETTDISNGGRSLFLAYANPNYTAQLLVASLGFKW